MLTNTISDNIFKILIFPCLPPYNGPTLFLTFINQKIDPILLRFIIFAQKAAAVKIGAIKKILQKLKPKFSRAY